MLGQRRIRTAIWAGNCRTIAQSPPLRMAAASHCAVDGDPSTLIALDRDCARDRTWDDPRRQYDRASVDRVVLEPHALGLDCPDRGRDLDVHSAPLEQARCCRPQLLVNLWQNPRSGLE